MEGTERTEATAGPPALVAGEALVDVVVTPDGAVTERPGGSAANVAVALARLGRPVGFATAFARDERGATLARHLDAAGVRLAADPHLLERTATARATIGPDGAASYEFDLAWRLAEIELDPAPRVVHVCSLGAVLAPGADAVAALAERARDVATLSYDVNMRPAITGVGEEVLARVERLAGLADVVKASDEDLEALWPARSIEESAAHLLRLGPAVVVVTRGVGGALFLCARGEGTAPAVPVTVADTIGAGDTFSAATLDALWERDLLGAAHRDALAELGVEVWTAVFTHAARAAAITVSRPGADPPYRKELR